MNEANRVPIVGCGVVYVDAHGAQHNALVTAVWGSVENMATQPPCINVVMVSADESKQDQYGRQIWRETSVVYRTVQPAHGFYYMFPGETPNPHVAPLQS